jgi:hypothetical protein
MIEFLLGIIMFLGMCGDGTLVPDMQFFFNTIIHFIWNKNGLSIFLGIIFFMCSLSDRKERYKRKKYPKF